MLRDAGVTHPSRIVTFYARGDTIGGSKMADPRRRDTIRRSEMADPRRGDTLRPSRKPLSPPGNTHRRPPIALIRRANGNLRGEMVSFLAALAVPRRPRHSSFATICRVRLEIGRPGRVLLAPTPIDPSVEGILARTCVCRSVAFLRTGGRDEEAGREKKLVSTPGVPAGTEPLPRLRAI